MDNINDLVLLAGRGFTLHEPPTLTEKQTLYAARVLPPGPARAWSFIRRAASLQPGICALALHETRMTQGASVPGNTRGISFGWHVKLRCPASSMSLTNLK
jgi:hypothetical protein